MGLLQSEVLKNIFFKSTPAGLNPDSLAQATRCLRCAGLGTCMRQNQAQRAKLIINLLSICYQLQSDVFLINHGTPQ